MPEVEITDQGITIGKDANTVRLSHAELSPNFGDSQRVQAAAVWEREDAGLTATSIPLVNLDTLNELGQLVVAVDPAPILLGALDKLEDHGERSLVRQTPS